MIVVTCVILSAVGSVSSIMGFASHDLSYTLLGTGSLFVLGLFMGGHIRAGK